MTKEDCKKTPSPEVQWAEKYQNAELTPANFYILESYHTDWDYLIHKLAQSHPGSVIGMLFNGQTPVYYAPKDGYTDAEIGKLVGMAPEIVHKATVFRLKPLGNQKCWEKPTVDYFGEA